MRIFQLIRFFEKAGTYVSPEEGAVEQAGTPGGEHVAYHKHIVRISILFGLLGVLFGPGVSAIAAAGHGRPGEAVQMVLFSPFLFGAAGLLFGVAVACLFAPRRFLTGPAGQKWMQLIGTENVLVARIVCLLLGLIIGGVPTALGLFVAFAR